MKNKFETELFKRDLEENGEKYTDEISQKAREITDSILNGYDFATVAVKKYSRLVVKIREEFDKIVENPEFGVNIQIVVNAVFPFEWLEILKSEIEKKQFGCTVEKTEQGKNTYVIKIQRNKRSNAESEMSADEKNNKD